MVPLLASVFSLESNGCLENKVENKRVKTQQEECMLVDVRVRSKNKKELEDGRPEDWKDVCLCESE